MKRLALPALLIALICLIATPFLIGSTTSPTASPASTTDKPSGNSISSTITAVTGIAISPLLGTGAYGAYKYITAKDASERAALPWFAQWKFFVPALLFALVCAFKDALGAILPPGWKKPFDILEAVESKVSALIVAASVIPIVMDSLRGHAVSTVEASGTAIHTGINSANFAMMHLGTIDFSWLLNIITVPLGIVMFLIVWMAAHSINVLILLSPWGVIDTALKTMRTALIGLLTIAAAIDPFAAAIVSVVVIIVSYFAAGWSFRLMIFGTVFCWDFFTLKKKRFKVHATENDLFSAACLKSAPLRSFGKLINEPTTGRMRFEYKPWLVLSKCTGEVKLSDPFIGKGLFFSSVRDGESTYFLLPPRYRGHEEELARAYGFAGGVKNAGILNASVSMRELFAGSATNIQVMPNR